MSKRDVYDRFEAAFSKVSAYVLLNSDGRHVGLIAFKHPKDGAGRLSCFLHISGSEMVQGTASGYGYGYDKRTAAVLNAVEKLGRADRALDTTTLEATNAIIEAFDDPSGQTWEYRIIGAGLTVCRAV